MSIYGMGRCAPCEGLYGVRGPGLGAIVMQPLNGGLADPADAVMRMGAAVPAAAMLGAGVGYGAIGGWAGQSWRVAGNSALMGAGLVGLLSGIGLMGVGAVASAAPPVNDPVPVIDQGAAGLGGLMAPGIGYAVVGGALLGWGAWRAYKKAR